MRLSDLQDKDIVNICDGKKVGNIIDVSISEDGNMIGLIVEKGKTFSSFFKGTGEIEIHWKQIKKIGEDVILVEMKDLL